MSHRLVSLSLIALAVFALAIAGRVELTAAPAPAPRGDDSKPQQAAKEALAQFNSLIGGWRGVGQPRRGSAAGSWKETASWVWDFSQPAPAIRYEVTDGKLVKEARLTYDPSAGRFHAVVTEANGTTRDYAGKLTDDRLLLESKPDAKHEVHRITVTRLNEKRTVVLFEKKRASARTALRVAEVGYTREGTRLAVEGADGPECIVTGGKGTIQVSYKGQTYYVCCSGCRQAFHDNPEKILAEYHARVAKRNAESK